MVRPESAASLLLPDRSENDLPVDEVQQHLADA